MNKKIKVVFSVIATLSLSYFAVNAWNGLIAEDGDSLNFEKWNELANLATSNQASGALLESRVDSVETLANQNQTDVSAVEALAFQNQTDGNLLEVRVDDLEASSGGGGTTYSSGVGEKKSYNHVIAINTGNCPSGYETINFSDVVFSNNHVYATITEHSVSFGTSSHSYGHEYIRLSAANTLGIQKFCKKTYTSYSRPYITLLTYDTANASNCPSGFNYLDNNTIKGSNDWTYFMAHDGGSYIGPITAWSPTATTYENGWSKKSWRPADGVNSICYKIDGVQENDSTKDGVYPVLLGVTDQAACTSLGTDWHYKDSNEIKSSGGTFYSTITDNSFDFGQNYTSSYGGENYAYVHHSTHLSTGGICMKLFPSFNSSVSVRVTQETSCPTGHISIDASKLVGNNTTRYLQKTKYGMYIGGLYTWARSAQKDGWQTDNWTTTSAINRVCIKFEN